MPHGTEKIFIKLSLYPLSILTICDLLKIKDFNRSGALLLIPQ